MKSYENILICGLGAIGSIYAEKISNCKSKNLKILVDKQRLEKYKNNPPKFNGKELNLEYILPENKNFTADLIIISTKSYSLENVIKNIKNFVGENTVIISLINGVTSEKIIAKTYGRDKILYSYFIGHSAVRKGPDSYQDGINSIVFGIENSQDIGKGNKLKEFFKETSINYEISNDIIRSMWLKFMLNVSANQTTAILKMTFGEVLDNKNCMKFIENIMQEVLNIAIAEGVNNTETMLFEGLEQFKKMSPDGKTSMLQDIEAGRETEVDIFAGTVIDLGKKHNIETPYNKILKEMIDIL